MGNPENSFHFVRYLMLKFTKSSWFSLCSIPLIYPWLPSSFWLSTFFIVSLFPVPPNKSSSITLLCLIEFKSYNITPQLKSFQKLLISHVKKTKFLAFQIISTLSQLLSTFPAPSSNFKIINSRHTYLSVASQSHLALLHNQWVHIHLSILGSHIRSSTRLPWHSLSLRLIKFYFYSPL